jgi:hypothetical protein
MNINVILETAPGKIAEYAELENKAYALMLTSHEEYKQQRAKKYLEQKAEGGTIKDLEYKLDVDAELIAVKNKEVFAEIDYRAFRTKRNRAEDFFQAAMEKGRTVRAEMRSLGDTINTKGE